MPRFASSQAGFAIREGDGYYEMNGIGDWSFAGDVESASIFPTKAEAQEAVDDYALGEGVEIVPISRAVQVEIGE